MREEVAGDVEGGPTGEDEPDRWFFSARMD